ncbi:phage tail protein, partial [Bisgaard Taxon 45]
MAKQYYSVLTTYGSQQLATAIATRQPLNITHFAVGDGNGQTVTPNVARTALVHEVHRATISAVSRDPRNNKQVIFELTIPEDVGGFHIREMGIFDNQNKLIAYANCPESFKPTLSSGSGKIQVMRMILLIESSDAVTMTVDDTVIFVTRGQLTPKKITAESQNGVDNDGHSHEIESASTTVKGIVQLTDELNINNSTLALTAKAGKTLAERIRQAIAMFSNYIPNSKKSSAVNSNSEDTIGTSKAVKIAYDRAVEAEKKGLPVGAIVAFHKSAKPHGYLKAIGGTFNQATYPDLYVANGNSEIIPNVHRSDVGMTAY